MGKQKPEEFREHPDLPYMLEKCLTDCPFSYAVGLRDGTVLFFHEASREGDWIRFEEIEEHNILSIGSRRFNFERGLEVRISDIMWVSDAPYGS